jgi:hypothetical protein
MTTLRLFASGTLPVHPTTAWYLADLGEFRGMQPLYTQQSPQRLKALREHALIKSAVSSNRIEGVSIEPARVRDVLVAAKPLFRDRDEEEVRGYRDAPAWVHQEPPSLTETTVLWLCALARGEIWDAGRYKGKDGDIIERYSDGSERGRFRTVPAAATPERMAALLADWRCCLDESWVHPLIALAAFNLDFYAYTHSATATNAFPACYGCCKAINWVTKWAATSAWNAWWSRNKARYYETLEQSSQGWHEGKHDPWPFINYVLFILKTAYREFAERCGEVKAPRGAKTEQMLAAIGQFAGEFTLSQLEQRCPGVSRDMVRRVLRGQQADGQVVCQGWGPAAS